MRSSLGSIAPRPPHPEPLRLNGHRGPERDRQRTPDLEAHVRTGRTRLAPIPGRGQTHWRVRRHRDPRIPTPRTSHPREPHATRARHQELRPLTRTPSRRRSGDTPAGPPRRPLWDQAGPGLATKGLGRARRSGRGRVLERDARRQELGGVERCHASPGAALCQCVPCRGEGILHPSCSGEASDDRRAEAP